MDLRGAVALVVERRLDLAVPQLVVPSVRRAMPAAATLFFGTAFPLCARWVWVCLSSSSAANSSTPISEPVAATLAALATSLTASTSTSAIEARFFCAIFKAS